jgi:arginine deiminase
MLALAPGKLIGFRRNQRTIELLRQRGVAVSPAESENGRAGFLDWTKQEVTSWLDDHTRKSIIAIRDEELSRAHGGPRSLVLPLRRDPVPV